MTPIILVVGLMVLGLALIAIEVLVIPGFGVVGVMGGASMIGSVWVAYEQVSPAYSVIAVIAGLGASGLMFWLFPKTKAGKAMVLKAAVTGKAGRADNILLEGREGVVLTDLRPSGSVEIDDRSVDVVTDGRYVEKGTKVRVVRVEGARVVVEPLS
jgi:membrane-bound serine protease (ClpP class)